MISDVVLAAAIPAVASVLVQLIIGFSKRRETDAKLAVHEQRQVDALDELKRELGAVKKRLDMHNGYAEKFASSDKNIALIQRDVEYLKKAIDSRE